MIADDLTGAAEIGGIGLRHGLNAEVFVDAAALQPRTTTRLVCLDSDSRSSSPAEAASKAEHAALALAKLDPNWIYKKVDSVLRGNVIAEITAIASVLGINSALLVPANPSFGRVIRDGNYYLKGQPISETDFARDPEYPRTSSNVLNLLGAELSPAVHVLKPGDALPPWGISLGEAASPSDVERWAEYRNVKVLCAGGAEFFNALLRSSAQQANVAQKFDHRSVTRDLFICGSASDYTRRFVEESRTSGIPVFYLPQPTHPHNSPSPALHLAAVVASACKSHPRVIVSTPANIVSDLHLARQLSLQLVELAAVVLRIATIDRICVEGGATAAALIRKLEWDIFDVVEEIAPGVTTLAPRDAGLLLTVKPGSYPGWPPTEK